MRIGAVSAVLALTSFGASAQNFATSEQPYPTTAPEVTAAPAYEAYEPSSYDAGAYEAATSPVTVAPAPEAAATVGGFVPAPPPVGFVVQNSPAPLPPTPITEVPPSTAEAFYQPIPQGAVQYETAPTILSVPTYQDQTVAVQAEYPSSPNDPALGDNLSLPLGSPETFASSSGEPAGEIGFSQETETSRLLLALEETYTKRLSELKVQHLAQRRAVLNAFEKDASDPNKVIGLADRMRQGLAELEAAQKAALAEEERQYTAAMLSVLDAAPTRAQ